MLFAAGLGTRLRPLTDHRPKALVEIDGQPLLSIVLNRLKEAGFEQVVVNVHHFSEMIKEYLSNHTFDMDIRISDETGHLLDTGGGLKQAISHFDYDDDPILIHNVDIISDAPLEQFYDTCRGCMASLMVSVRDSSRRLFFDESNQLCGWYNLTTGETKSPYTNFQKEKHSSYSFSGIHLVSPHIIDYMHDCPSAFPIIPFYLSICNKIPIQSYPVAKLHLLDVGKPEALRQAALFLAKESTDK